MKHPWRLNKDDLELILNKPVKVGLGEPNKVTANEEIQGVIYDFTLAGVSSPPNLIGHIYFRTNDGKEMKIIFSKIKWILEVDDCNLM
jgi:hypothetical protein